MKIYEINGQVPSIKNSRQIVRVGGRRFVLMNKSVKVRFQAIVKQLSSYSEFLTDDGGILTTWLIQSLTHSLRAGKLPTTDWIRLELCLQHILELQKAARERR